MDARHYEGIMSLVQMAVATAMEKAGVTKLHITREDLATAFDRLHITFSNGVADGMRFEVQPKRIEPTDEAPPESRTTPKPTSGANPGCPCPASCDEIKRCYGGCKANQDAEQAARWRALCEKAFGPGAHLAANIVSNMEKAVALNWDDREPEAPPPVVRTVVDCGYCHGEGYLKQGLRKRECPDCHGEGTVEADA